MIKGHAAGAVLPPQCGRRRRGAVRHPKQVKLVPHGSTLLRITVFPWAEE